MHSHIHINAKLPKKVLFLLSYAFMTSHYKLKDVPASYIRLHASALRSFNVQKRAIGKDKHFSPADPDASNRRAFIMSCFGVAYVESIRTGSFVSFANLFPSLTIQFPQENDGTIVSKKLLSVLKNFMKKPKYGSEASLRYNLWDKIFDCFFSNFLADYGPQLNISTMDSRYPDLFIDGAVCIEILQNDERETLYLPLMLVEMDKHQLKIQYDHKDIVKMALSMGAALKRLIGICRNESLVVLKNLFVAGFLIGGSLFDLCFMYPDFGTARECDFGLNKPFPPFGMVFKHSREYWRFDIFGDQMVDLNTAEASKFFYMPGSKSGSKGNFEIDPVKNSALNYHKNNNNHEGSVHVGTNIEKIAAAIELEIDFIDVQVKNENETIDPYQSHSVYSPERINMQSVQILAQVATMVKTQAKTVDKIIKSRPPLNEKDFETETEKFLFDKKIALHIPSGRKTFSSASTFGTYQGL